MDGGVLIGVGIVLLIGVIMFVIYAVGIKYTYDRGNAFGQNYQGTRDANGVRNPGVNVYDAPDRERTVGR